MITRLILAYSPFMNFKFNTVIFKSYSVIFSDLAKNLATSILNLIFSSSFYSLVTSISIRSDFSIQYNMQSHYSVSHQPTSLYCSCWSSSYSQHQPICSFRNLGHSLHYLLWTFWSNSSWILSSAPLVLFLQPNRRKKFLEWHCFFNSYFFYHNGLSQLLLKSSNHLNSLPLP